MLFWETIKISGNKMMMDSMIGMVEMSMNDHSDYIPISDMGKALASIPEYGPEVSDLINEHPIIFSNLVMMVDKDPIIQRKIYEVFKVINEIMEDIEIEI